MIDRMVDRCLRICGTGDRPCYVNSGRQLNCISDVVINKTTVAAMLLDICMEESLPTGVTENIHESIRTINELSNWMKYLQLIRDMKQLSSLVLDAEGDEKRREIRYPVPMQYMEMMRVVAGDVEGQVSNFSQSGIQIASDRRIEAAGPIECLLVTDSFGGGQKRLPFTMDVRYSVPLAEGRHYTGGLVLRLGSRDAQFNFFTDVHAAIMELIMIAA